MVRLASPDTPTGAIFVVFVEPSCARLLDTLSEILGAQRTVLGRCRPVAKGEV